MASVPVVCPKCQQPIEPYQFTFTRNGKLVTLQKCPTCEYEWSGSPRAADQRTGDARKSSERNGG